MNAPIPVPAHEHAIVRLFSLNMRPQQARFLTEPGAVDQALGVSGLDPEQFDIIALADLGEIGLAGYLEMGCAIAPDQIDQAQLASLTGHVLLIRSNAFGGRAITLNPIPALSLIATYSETPADWSANPMPAQPIRRKTPPRAARSQARRIGFTIFAAMMLLLAALAFWILT